MSIINWEQAERALEKYYQEHPEERNKKYTAEELIEIMKNKGFHFSNEEKPKS